MTKKEIKLTQENKELKEQLKAKTHKDKPLFKTKYFTTSKIALHFTHIIIIAIVTFIAIMCCKYLYQEPVYLASVLAAMATNGFVTLNITTKYYTEKAMADSDNINKKEKYEMKMKLAERMSELLANNKISVEGVELLRAVISETETTLATNGYGGSTVIEQQTFGVQNPMVDTPVIDNTLDVNSNLSDQRYT